MSLNFVFILEYDMRQDLKFIKIKFETPLFDIVTKDRAAKFVNMVGEIGGTMGLLTGFSIITAVEIVYFSLKIISGFLKLMIPNNNIDNKNNVMIIKPED